jgi:hypothetical protein
MPYLFFAMTAFHFTSQIVDFGESLVTVLSFVVKSCPVKSLPISKYVADHQQQ